MSDTAKLTATLSEAYATDAPALRLGAGIADGQPLDAQINIPLRVLNRHGLIAGATGTGKTKTLQLITEQLSAQGVPVFVADMKGDLSGLASPGKPHPKIDERAEQVGQDWEPQGFPVEFFSLGGRGEGVPIRCTVTSFGPMLLSKVLGLTEVQSSSLQLIFHYADKAGLPILDLKDLRSVVSHLVSDEGKAELKELGGISSATAGVILRELIAFAESGAEDFFGEPQFEAEDFLRTNDDGLGIISCLRLAEVSRQPALFSSFLMWLLADLFDILPEVGDQDKPKLVFFFDEAHLIFNDAPDHLIEHISHTVRLIRSKGVGVFFVTQHPTDVPPEVLGQLGSRVQHALRAFTPSDAKALKATVSTYPTSDFYDVRELLTSVGTGEAVVTVLNEKGAPTPVAWTRLRAPLSLMAPSEDSVIKDIANASTLMEEYGQMIDRESAFEKLQARSARDAEAKQQEAEPAPEAAPATHREERDRDRRDDHAAAASGGIGGMVGGVLSSRAFQNFARSAGRTLGREITRSLFGTSRRSRR